MIAHIDLQTAVYKALSSGEWSVFETVPPQTKMPYITIGDATQINDHTKTNQRKVVNLIIHTWSKGTDSTESKMMDDFVQKQLLDQDIVMVDHNLDMASLSMLVSQKELTTDYTIFHSSLDFEIQISNK